MEPFFSGMAIGLAIVIPILVLLFAVRIVYLGGCFLYGFFSQLRTSAARQGVHGRGARDSRAL
jgi:hypothetical protein